MLSCWTTSLVVTRSLSVIMWIFYDLYHTVKYKNTYTSYSQKNKNMVFMVRLIYNVVRYEVYIYFIYLFCFLFLPSSEIIFAIPTRHHTNSYRISISTERENKLKQRERETKVPEFSRFTRFFFFHVPVSMSVWISNASLQDTCPVLCW